MKKLIAGVSVVFSIMALPAFAVSLGTSLSVSASSSASGNVGVKTNASAAQTRAETRADQEIARRTEALNTLQNRVSNLRNISADEKTSLSATIQGQLDAMANLKSEIGAAAAENATSSLKADVQSITTSYRIFALIIPQGTIEAAADRVLTVASMMQKLSAALQVRVGSSTVDANATSTASLIADLNAKVADAQTQAQAAINETASLQPDQGDVTVKQSNTATLKDARAKIRAAQKDLITARADIRNIVKIVIK